MASDFFRIVQDPAVTVIELFIPEQLDSSEFDRINEGLLAAFSGKAHGQWVLDLSNLTYVGSSVLGLMVNIRQRVKLAGGRLALCGMSQRLLRVFQTCCLERLFVIKSDRAEAVKALAR